MIEDGEIRNWNWNKKKEKQKSAPGSDHEAG